jgi:hypothetical protein
MINKFLIFLLFLLLVNNSFAEKYMCFGTVLGETDNKVSTNDLGITNADIRYQGFSGRYFIGYNFSRDFGLECSWLHSHRVRILNINNSQNNGELNINIFGLLAKFGIDISNYYQLAVKFGGVYVKAKPDQFLSSNSSNHYSRDAVAHWRPAIEVGIVKRFFTYFDFGVVWHYVAEHRALPHTSLIGFNLSFVLDHSKIFDSKNV